MFSSFKKKNDIIIKIRYKSTQDEEAAYSAEVAVAKALFMQWYPKNVTVELEKREWQHMDRNNSFDIIVAGVLAHTNLWIQEGFFSTASDRKQDFVKSVIDGAIAGKLPEQAIKEYKKTISQGKDKTERDAMDEANALSVVMKKKNLEEAEKKRQEKQDKLKEVNERMAKAGLEGASTGKPAEVTPKASVKAKAKAKSKARAKAKQKPTHQSEDVDPAAAKISPPASQDRNGEVNTKRKDPLSYLTGTEYVAVAKTEEEAAPAVTKTEEEGAPAVTKTEEEAAPAAEERHASEKEDAEVTSVGIAKPMELLSAHAEGHGICKGSEEAKAAVQGQDEALLRQKSPSQASTTDTSNRDAHVVSEASASVPGFLEKWLREVSIFSSFSCSPCRSESKISEPISDYPTRVVEDDFLCR